MAVQDESGGTNSNTIATADNRSHFDVVGARPIPGDQPKEIYLAGEEHATKVRKPYTIMKQRERWTEEEHKKFLEALKLHGRAWRKIEEHVGTKTAVQIRSHAQKFFSKVARESSSSNAGSVKPMEIPPPRPKKKPMHPYPRKRVHSLKKGVFVPEQPERSPSPNLSFSEQENQYPKSVLSPTGSDTMDSTVTNMQNNSSSQVSSVADVNPISLLSTEQEYASTSSAEEDNGTPFVKVTASSTRQEESSKKFSSGSKDDACTKVGSTIEAPLRSLKLFGKTVLVADFHRPSSSIDGSCKPSSSAKSHQENFDMNKKPVQTAEWKPIETDLSIGAKEDAWNHWPCGIPPVFYYMQCQREEPHPVEAASASAAALPWWALYGSLPFPFLPSHNMNSTQLPLESCPKQASGEKQLHKEGSWTGSNTALVSEAGEGEKNGDVVDSQSQEPSSDKEEKEKGPILRLRPMETSAFSNRRASSSKCNKGFVPYKRCIAERDTQSSSVIVGEEREGQRIRLCL